MVKYTRIDAADDLPLTFRVNDALRASPYLSGSNIRFVANNGIVKLRGTTRTCFQKQMAQEILIGMNGINTIENEIQVPSLSKTL